MRIVAVSSVLPSTILQRLGSDPAVLAAVLAGGVGVTAIAATGQVKEEQAPPPAEGAEEPAWASASPLPQPVLLDQAAPPATSSGSDGNTVVVTVGKEGATAAAEADVDHIVVEPVPATALGPYVPLPAMAEPVADPAPAVEPVADLPAPAPPMQLAEAPVPPTETTMVTDTAGEAHSSQSAEAEAALALPEPAAPAVPPEAVELAQASEVAPEPEAAESELPVEAANDVALVVAPVPEPDLTAEPDPAEPARATEPTPERSAFDLAFADLKANPSAEIATLPEAAAPQSPPPVALAATPAPAPAVASMAFDLAAIPALAPAEAGSAFIRPDRARGAPVARSAEPPAGGNRYRLTGNGIEFQIPAVLFGEELGTVPLRIGSTNLVSVRLADLLALVAERMDPAAYARLSGSRSAEEYVSFSTLRDAGIDLRYDAAHDRLILGE